MRLPILPAGALNAHLRFTLLLITLQACPLRLRLSPHRGGWHADLCQTGQHAADRLERQLGRQVDALLAETVA